ncbi:MAG: prolyl oligopeptidase family serine peptidase [Kiritimatiellaeota bacterium]|nr:prolyl oligopeptidase family serine peptidase [Kiritimatiellota bacterium]
MSFRNLSPQVMFEQMALSHTPRFKFEAETRDEFEAWKRAARPAVRQCLGDFPPRCALNPQLLAEWEHDGLRKQKWLIDVQPGLSATLLVNIPEGVHEDQPPRPAILCWHGHGPFGKEPVMGNDSSPDLRQTIDCHNYNYGHQMAKAGFVTFAIDWIGCGERNDTRKPQHRAGPGRDWCNLYYLHATMLGMTSISINVSHGMAATDFAASLPFVDETRLGVMGLSGGGTMTLWSAHCDRRFKAAEIICYSDLWAHFGYRHLNYCGMQVAPGLFKLVDLPDLQGLLAPLPLLVDLGVYDTCFIIDTAMACYRRVENIYRVAGASDRLELDLHPGEHGWGGNRSVAFFEKHLG